jgi:Tol biopolymer transport system component
MIEMIDRQVADWLHEGPDTGSRTGLDHALAATRTIGQRPGWTLPERWLPMQSTMVRMAPVPLRALLLLALLILAVVAATLAIGSRLQVEPAPPFRNGAVVFSQDGDLFIADQVGGTPRALTSGPDTDLRPVFSAQGDRIAFTRSAPDGVRIMAVSPDGSDVQELAHLSDDVTRMGWSPDGGALLVSTFNFRAGGNWKQTHVVRSDGSGFRTLDFGPGFFVVEASWRPNGRHIAFRAEKEVGTPEQDIHATGLYLADADGTHLRPLPIGPIESVRDVEWSPDGARIAFVTDDGAGLTGVSIADIDGDGGLTALHPLRPAPASSRAAFAAWAPPIWSPDGSQIALILTELDEEHVALVHPDGTAFRTVPDVPDFLDAHVRDVAWSPDGRSLVVTKVNSEIDPVTLDVVRATERRWILDLTTGEATEIDAPVDSWQRLAP